MRIAVLAHNQIVGGGLSVGRNITALLPKLSPQNDYLMFVPYGLDYDLHKDYKNVTVHEIKRMGLCRRLHFERYALPKQISEFQADWVLALGNIGLLKPKCRQAILFHQSQILYDSKYYGNVSPKMRIKYLMIKCWIKRSLKSTQILFCQTPVIKKRFSKVFQYPLELIKIAPNAVSEFAKINKPEAAILDVFRTKGTFDLFLLARYYPYKNIEVLIDIFREYPAELKDVRCIITISPQQNKNAKKLLNDIKRNKLEEKIVNVGPLKQGELAGYFCQSDALFFPTLLESFSATYLEAMYFSLPILTSDLDFSRYICDEAAVYFDPWDSKDIVDKILMMKKEEELRKQLIQKGQERISMFFRSWEQITSDMLQEIDKR